MKECCSTKLILLVASAIASVVTVRGQSNTFPASGNVGIGTTAPAYKLHVEGNSPTAAGIGIRNSTAGASGGIYVDNSAILSLGQPGVGQYLNVNLMNGNVGIGTTTPVAALEVRRDVAFNLGARLALTNYAGGTNAGASLDFSGTNTTSFDPQVRIQSLDDGNYSGHLVFLTKVPGANGNAVSERMRITSAGNVGIGTTNPVSQLHLRGVGQATNLVNTSGSLGGTLTLQDSGGSPYNGGAVVFGASQGFFAAIKGLITDGTGNTTGDLSFSTRNAYGDSVLTERLRISSSGNVGIGTSNPTQKLSVNGTIRAKEVIVEASPWPDYVFADDYKLAPLSEVEAHIKSEKHLPGMPSAEEVAEKGVPIGDMQARLLAKLEEMTLRMIAQEKDYKQLRSEVQALRERNAYLETHLASTGTDVGSNGTH